MNIEKFQDEKQLYQGVKTRIMGTTFIYGGLKRTCFPYELHVIRKRTMVYNMDNTPKKYKGIFLQMRKEHKKIYL